METKNPTKAQVEKRLQNAIVLVEKTKDTQSIYFSNKGLRLTVTDDYAVIETGYHRHVFSKVSGSMGISRPWLYTQRVIEIANENLDKIKTERGYSFEKLREVLKEKENQEEYNIAVYYEWWCSVIFDGLYSISENEICSWLVYFKFINIIATNSILLEEHKEDVTNKQFVEQFISRIKEFTEPIYERVILHKKTDEEIMKENIEAFAEQVMNETMEGKE